MDLLKIRDIRGSVRVTIRFDISFKRRVYCAYAEDKQCDKGRRKRPFSDPLTVKCS